jgi:hypothetical protein
MLAFPRLPARRLLRITRSYGLIFRIGGGSGATLMSGGMRHSVSGSSVDSSDLDLRSVTIAPRREHVPRRFSWLSCDDDPRLPVVVYSGDNLTGYCSTLLALFFT